MPGKIFSVDWNQVRKAASPSSPVAQTTAPSKPRADPYSDDPFFKRNPVSTWNACIGKQAYEEHYIDGYIEAAMELAWCGFAAATPAAPNPAGSMVPG